MAGDQVAFAKNDRIIPGAEWTDLTPGNTGWSTVHLLRLAQDLADGCSTALMIVEAGRVVFQWGDLACKSSVASVRKSLINILYGIYISEGRIDPNAALADFEIDDITPLTTEERTATVLDLLKARSGIYLPSVYDTERGRPPRGSHKPGTHWFYNNWDFNVLGSILQRQTGQTVFEAFEARVAKPLSMQDFSMEDGHFHWGPESRHPVYKMRMSTRDLARVGLLYLQDGCWGLTQVVPETWVYESTRSHSEVGEGRGYGYLWWTAAANAPGDSVSTDVPIFYANGAGGQYIIVLPAFDLVVVHKSARVDHGISHVRMGAILRQALAAMPERRRSSE
ncbi:beta-lactamase family protein [Agrobacterium sp. SHOUNA12C]|nr:beta-lactamase family protein [Agrobacterium sp. BETTINA12B]MCJ9755464.1 beta-lactamase family protein [Agrobacterium sp. SHOUNA12C]NTG34831.1 serine hydrolase [Rhizobium rhizogenes]NTG54080.1 serine hydrolase [Rhizobium rhizogenes]